MKAPGRTGYTTGSNAAAAAKAATLALLTGRWPAYVKITLPIGETATMQPARGFFRYGAAFCCMVKDAGDDPDVTHGALICARVRRVNGPGIILDGGDGVGRVTLPGLGLPVGQAAINPVPRQQILDNVADAIREAYAGQDTPPGAINLQVVISVPEGAQLAQCTLNPRLGILGGISILGTTGKVYPYSTESWRASVIQAVQVAAHNGVQTVVLSTGGRSEKCARREMPDLPDLAFVEMSTFTGDALEACRQHGIQEAVIAGMIAKLVKTAQGHMETPVSKNRVDLAFLAQVSRAAGAPDTLVRAIASANTARHMLDLCAEQGCMAPVQRVVELAREQCQRFVQERGGSLQLSVMLVGFDGKVVARAGA
jgi:cobalt-precorrin-5B (C1)-methyltransferase